MDLKNKNVLVTGSGGFIGSHLVERLVSLGAHVSAFVRYNARNDWGFIDAFDKSIMDKITVIQGDLKDSHAVRSASKGKDAIFHLGALIAIPYSYVHPRDYFDTNVIGTLNVMEAAREYGVDKVVHTSTSEVYGTAQFVPITEEHPLQGQSPYSASKIGADKVAESFYKSFDLPVSIVRPFNTYGPRQSARAIIPTIITQALTQKKISLGSLTPIRDFTYVEDTVDGFIKVAESKKSFGEVINIGSNKEISIKEIAETVIQLINPSLKLISEKQRIRPEKSEVFRLLADISKAKRLVDWKPKIDFSEGLKRTINYIKSNSSEYKPHLYNL